MRTSRPFTPARVITVSSLIAERQLPLALERHDVSAATRSSEITPLAAELPVRQQMVILLLRRGELANRIVQVLREKHTPEPVKSDWAAMLKSGHVTKQFYSGGSRLALTPGGLHSAQDLCRYYARQFAVHHIEFGKAIGNRGPWVRCVCGWSTYTPIGRSADSTLNRYASDHLAKARGAS